MKKIPVGVLGATGMVGQQYLQLLADHPWFDVSFLASSDNSAGKTYQEALLSKGYTSVPAAQRCLKYPVCRLDEIAIANESCRFVFSALGHEAAKLYEERYAEKGLPVISNAACHRRSSDVPLVIPEVNPDHIQIIPVQQKNRGWNQGFIAAKPNCCLQSYMIPLSPLHSKFGVQRLVVTTMQAVSGAGYPGVSSLSILDNVIPCIPNEEDKAEQEPLKIWGRIEGGRIAPAQNIGISAHCNRVPVVDGHLACVSVKFQAIPSEQDILSLWESFNGVPQQLRLPFAPPRPIIYLADSERPQPRLDRGAGNGMAVTVGRLRKCPVLDYRFTALSHNTIRGAAGGGILTAELLVERGYLGATFGN